MKTVWKVAIPAVILAVAIGGYFWYVSSTPSGPGQYDDFAKCLTQHSAVFYGAYWCPHCADQKSELGSSMKYINYVECDPRGTNAQPQLCADKGVTGYPTWIINGTSYQGTQPLSTLSSITGCPLS